METDDRLTVALMSVQWAIVLNWSTTIRMLVCPLDQFQSPKRYETKDDGALGEAAGGQREPAGMACAGCRWDRHI